jgi:arginyl-tRNA synthetase
MKEAVVEVLKKALKEKDYKLSNEEIYSLIETPKNISKGDFAFPCFSLSKISKLPPHEIALEVRAKIPKKHLLDFEEILVDGPYINFYLDEKEVARKAVWNAISKKNKYGMSKIGAGKKIIVEYSSPNIAKPLGIGQLRSTIIGNSVANMADFLGYKVHRLNYLGDWGTQFGKVLFGYEKFGSDAKLMKDPLKHLMDVYVKVNKKSLEPKAKEYFNKLENGDKPSLMLWKIFRDASIKELKKLYSKLGMEFDEWSGESKSINKTEKVFENLLKKKIIKKSKGAYIANLKEYGLDILVIKKDDGGSTYALRDLATAIDRKKKKDFFKMIYETGQEQSLYFKQVFKLLELLGLDWAKDCFHVDHGFYLDKDGKRFSTRKGKLVFAKDILEEIQDKAKKEISKRFKLSKIELERRSNAVAVAALFYGDLKTFRRNDVVFDAQTFVSFEGNTGPYLLYSYARASSIIEKSKQPGKFEILNLKDSELFLSKKINEFPEIVSKAFNSSSPSLIANYCYDLSKLFNTFYHSCQVIDSENESFRLALVEAFRITLRNSLNLLGINVIDKM